MKCMITGATGFIGKQLVNELLRRNFELNLLIRSKYKIPEHFQKKVLLFSGDLSNKQAIEKATEGCDFVFHLAAFANIWSKDKRIAYKTNVEGTENILSIAFHKGIKKVVFTSSAGLLPPSVNGEIIDESAQMVDFYNTDYEKTKREAELICMNYLRKGLKIVIVSPSRVFGPGVMNKSNSVTILIKKYISGNWHLIPGSGNQIGNYAFIDDVVEGHIKALEWGLPGKKYILGGTNISYNEFFDTIEEVNGKKYRLFHIPIPMMSGFASFELFCAEIFGKPPLITPAWLKKYNQNRLVSSQKAIADLNYSITPFNEGIKKTILWLNSQLK